MSLLDMLLNDSQDLNDRELLHFVETLEYENFITGLSDRDVVLSVEAAEHDFPEEFLDWGSETDSQVLHAVHDLEESCETLTFTGEMDVVWGDVSDAELLRDVTVIESSLNHLLGPVPATFTSSISQYQGPSVPMPTLRNNTVIIPQVKKATKVQCKPTFDLGFFPPSSPDDSASQHVCNKTTDALYILNMRICQYHEARGEQEMEKMGMKKFAAETDKKIR